MKLYLAGPMTNYPQFNYPAFHAAAAKLRAAGHEIISPAEQDPGGTQADAMASADGNLTTVKETYGSMMARDVKFIIDDCDGIVVLPNWEDSRGARIEVFIALSMDKGVWKYWADCSEPRGEALDNLELRNGLSCVIP